MAKKNRVKVSVLLKPETARLLKDHAKAEERTQSAAAALLIEHALGARDRAAG